MYRTFIFVSFVYMLISLNYNIVYGQNTNNRELAKKAIKESHGKKRSFHFIYTAYINAPLAKSKIQQVWLPVPQTNAYQDITNLQIYSPQTSQFSFHIDKQYGNKIAYVEIKNPKSSLTIVMELDCVRYQQPRPQFINDILPTNPYFLSSTRLLAVNDKTKKLAIKLTAEKTNNKEKLQALYDEVMDKMKYAKPSQFKGHGLGDGWGDGSTDWAMNKCFGNCTDFHAYYLSLLRSIEVPSRFEIGAWLHADKKQGKVGYHCWALSWNKENGWFPVDISEGWKGIHQKAQPALAKYYFGNLCVNRIQFTVGRDLYLLPRQQAKPLNYFIYPYSEADGKPVKTNVSFEYRDYKK